MPPEADSLIVILHSGGAAGRLFPCLPDLAATAALRKAKLKSKLICWVYGRMGVSAVNISGCEIQQGLAFFKQGGRQGSPAHFGKTHRLRRKKDFPGLLCKKVR